MAGLNLKDSADVDDDSKHFENDSMPNCAELLFSLIPVPCLSRCKRSRKYIAMEKAREMLAEETNIISVIRRQRFMRQALRYLLPEKKMMEFAINSNFVLVNPEEDDNDDYLA